MLSNLIGNQRTFKRLLKRKILLPSDNTPQTCACSSYRHNISGKVFSVVKIVKTDLRNCIGDEFLNDCIICFVVQEFLHAIPNDDVVVRFQNMNDHTHRVKQ